MIVKFWWEDGEFLAEIEGKGLTKEKIEKLLDEYRKEDEYYDNTMISKEDLVIIILSFIFMIGIIVWKLVFGGGW